jgi:hypothetical protein
MYWQTVRFDPTYDEKIDPEILPLCDALQAAGFNTISSCCGHGTMWPHVWWDETAPDDRCERLARFLLSKVSFDYAPYRPSVEKHINEVGHQWCLDLHLNNVYQDTPAKEALAMAVSAINEVAGLVKEFGATP